MGARKNAAILNVIGALALLSGCASMPVSDPKDPWEVWNRKVQVFNDHVDDYVMKPVARGYRWITPDFVDTGVTNFFSNIGDIRVMINNALQGKMLMAGMDGARFLVNSVAGIGGFFDVATEIDLPRHKEDFDQTLGYWGMPAGPYMVLPLLGPSSTRGVLGLLGDVATNPISYTGLYVSPAIASRAISGGLGALNAADMRADNLETEKAASEAAIDRYAFFRGAYLSQREYLISDGTVSEDVLNLEDVDDKLSPVNPY